MTSQDDSERRANDLPLEFDSESAEPVDATVAARNAGGGLVNSAPEPEPVPAAAKPAPAAPPPEYQRPKPMISAVRRPDSLTTQSISDEQRVAARTIRASALPGAKHAEHARRVQIQYGRVLAEQRKKSNHSIDGVAAATMIRSDYLEALEREDFERLPPPVYVIAYVRKLAKFYHLAPELTEELIGEVKERLEYTVPEEVLSRLEFASEPCEENERTMKRILLGLFIGVPLVILLIVFGILFATRSSSETAAPAPGQQSRLAESEVEFLLPQPVLEIPELPRR